MKVSVEKYAVSHCPGEKLKLSTASIKTPIQSGNLLSGSCYRGVQEKYEPKIYRIIKVKDGFQEKSVKLVC